MQIDIYCRVIDNYGDAGVCLRLARMLKTLGHQVALFCDDLAVLRRIALPCDDSEGLNFLPFEAEVSYMPDAVVEAFLCHLPEKRAAALKAAGSLVICLDYLSAEKWVEDFHGLRSPGEFANCYYFYPGFTKRTGGLTIETAFRTLAAPKPQYCAGGIRRATLFSYSNPALMEIVKLLQTSAVPTEFSVFEGLALDNINKLYGLKLKCGDTFTDGSVTFKVVPMVSQQGYDEILCSSDLNLVRGEDSIVRAMYCGRPFLWQIYPQDEDTHIVKLKAFMALMQEHCGGLAGAATAESSAADSAALSENAQAALPDDGQGPAVFNQLMELMLCYNERAKLPELNFDEFEQGWRELCWNFHSYLSTLPVLACSLSDFIEVKLKELGRLPA